ncbi:MAG: hypothetical protein HQL16_07650 [Candidatus Omnitrophica bacterium]|nr:hypothetical protein [Candidatus Omnitrophota bacterium]
MGVVESEDFKKICAIDAMALRLHGDTGSADAYIFKSLLDHVEEVRVLKAGANDHWKAESVDIIIHNLVLLSRHGVSEKDFKAILDRRLLRFEEKISGALKQKTT